MQAAPIEAMREIAATGNARKMILAFTHFDEVKGDNLDTSSARARHVLESAENVLRAIGEDLGSFAERALRKQIETARVFLGGIQEVLRDHHKADRRTIKQLKRMVDALEAIVLDRMEAAEAHPSQGDNLAIRPRPSRHAAECLVDPLRAIGEDLGRP